MGLNPINTIKANLGIEPNGKIQSFFTATCAKHMDKYVPDGDTLALRNSVKLTSDAITYQSPYAHYMWYGKVMGNNIPIKENEIIVGWFSPKGKPKHYTGADINYHGSTYSGHHWDSRMWSAEKNEVIKEVQDYIRSGK